jgi:diaminopropionate ammonia-lyase
MNTESLSFPFELALNPAAQPGGGYPAEAEALLSAAGHEAAYACISAWPGYEVTPLRDLAGLARELGIASLHYKDEAGRFGLGSFKPLGGAYAVARLLQIRIVQVTGRDAVSIDAILQGEFLDVTGQVTVTAATDGNHGRSVAWGARLFGCRCVIFIHETVTKAREKAIAAFGAEVRRTPGTFDDAVRKAQATAEVEGWYLVPDTSDGSIVEAPRNVMQGYSVMAGEAIAQLPYSGPPSHLFLQAGVGGMAAATCAQFWQAFGPERPKTLLVEPASAACWFASLKAGRPVAVGGDLDSIMAGLACGEVSRLAWDILGPGALAAISIADPVAVETMRLLAGGACGAAPIVAGESGVGGLAGLLAVASDQAVRERLALDETARVVVFGTEGASDPESYAEIIGRSAEEVAA